MFFVVWGTEQQVTDRGVVCSDLCAHCLQRTWWSLMSVDRSIKLYYAIPLGRGKSVVAALVCQECGHEVPVPGPFVRLLRRVPQDQDRPIPPSIAEWVGEVAETGTRGRSGGLDAFVSTPPGWYPDEDEPDRLTWWDGSDWAWVQLTAAEHARVAASVPGSGDRADPLHQAPRSAEWVNERLGELRRLRDEGVLDEDAYRDACQRLFEEHPYD